MSRRRPQPFIPPGQVQAELFCSGGQRQHAEYRIARVRVQPSGSKDVPWIVRVEYVHRGPLEEAAESDAFRVDHLTRDFDCTKCGRHKPLTDDKLGSVVYAAREILGLRRVDIARLS